MDYEKNIPGPESISLLTVILKISVMGSLSIIQIDLATSSPYCLCNFYTSGSFLVIR